MTPTEKLQWLYDQENNFSIRSNWSVGFEWTLYVPPHLFHTSTLSGHGDKFEDAAEGLFVLYNKVLKAREEEKEKYKTLGIPYEQ